jgi:hypothetical protein
MKSYLPELKSIKKAARQGYGLSFPFYIMYMNDIKFWREENNGEYIPTETSTDLQTV